MSYQNIPAELKNLPQWVVRKGKRPYDPRSGGDAKAGQPETWATYGQAVYATGYDGIGFEFAEGGGIVGIDLDTVRNPKTGFIAPEAADIIRTMDSYTEISPSGYGFHIYIHAAPDLRLPWHKAPLPENGIERFEKDSRTGKTRKKKPEIEVYNAGRYFTVTGNRYGERRTVKERGAKLAALLNCYSKAQAEPQRAAAMSLPTFDSDKLHTGLEKDQKFRSLWNGDRPNGNESGDDQALMNKLAYWCNCDKDAMLAAFRNSNHYATKDREHMKKAQRTDYLDRTANRAIKDCRETAAEADERYQAERIRQDFSPQETKDDKFAPRIVRAIDVPYTPPRWLIAPYFQRGKGTLIQADNGTGKTVFMCSIAAHVSTGRPILGLPIETPGDVLVLSVEDELPTLRGRIEADGGDLSRCHLIEHAAGLTLTSPEIEEFIKATNAKLLIFDPLQAFLGSDVDMFRANQTRPVLAKLFDMCDRNDCACAIISHEGKNTFGKSAVNRALGSVDIPASMRSILQIIQDPSDPSLIVAVHVKCSNAPRGKSLSYRIVENGGLTWEGFSEITVEDLAAIEKRREKEKVGLPYEKEPLVQVFNQLITDRPGGGFWSYDEVKRRGAEILGFPPFSSTNDLKNKLDGGLTKELQKNDSLIVTHGVKQNGARGIRIDQYKVPENYQTHIDT